MPFLNPKNFAKVHRAVRWAADRNIDALKALQLLDTAKLEVADPALRDQAHELYGSDDIEIDDEGVGTAAADNGVWVQAWVFVRQESEDDDPDYDDDGNLRPGGNYAET